MEHIIPMVESLVNDYNWNMGDLNNLTEQFFGDES